MPQTLGRGTAVPVCTLFRLGRRVVADREHRAVDAGAGYRIEGIAHQVVRIECVERRKNGYPARRAGVKQDLAATRRVRMTDHLAPRLSRVVLGALVLALGACSPDRAIERDAERLEGELAAWWEAETAAPADSADDARGPPERSWQERFTLASLHPREGADLPRPRQARGAGWEARDAGVIGNRRAILWVRSGAACRDVPSYLAVEPFEAWTELPVAPGCIDGGAEAVVFTLHALHEITWPALEVEAGGFRALYRFDEGEGRYRPPDPTRPPRRERAR